MTSTIKTLALMTAGVLFAPAAMAGDEITRDVSAVLDTHSVELDAKVHGDTVIIEGRVKDYAKADQAVVSIAKLPGIKTIINRVRVS